MQTRIFEATWIQHNPILVLPVRNNAPPQSYFPYTEVQLPSYHINSQKLMKLGELF